MFVNSSVDMFLNNSGISGLLTTLDKVVVYNDKNTELIYNLFSFCLSQVLFTSLPLCVFQLCSPLSCLALDISLSLIL